MSDRFQVAIALGLRHLAVALRGGLGLHGPSIEAAIHLFTMGAVVSGGREVFSALPKDEVEKFCALVDVDHLLGGAT